MKQKSNILVLVTIIVALAIGAVIYYKSNSSQPETTKSAEQTKTFQSKNLKFSIEYPSRYNIRDSGITVTLSNDLGEIKISRNGTQFERLSDYLKDFDSKRDLKVEQENNILINGLESVKRIQYFTVGPANKHTIYFILKDNAVYDVSATSESLFDDLDQIAQSFRYTP